MLNNNGRGRLGDGGLGLADTQCSDVSRGSKAEVGVDGTRVSSVGRDMTGSVNDPDLIVWWVFVLTSVRGSWSGS